MTTKVTRKDRELRHAGAFLQRIGEFPKQWNIVDSDRECPDLFLRSPTGKTIGLEVTELLTDDYGELRTAENKLSAVIQEVVQQFIESIGLPGAIVFGNNKSIAPPHKLRLEELRVNLREHLQQHGHALSGKAGPMLVPFKHDWGIVASIHGTDNPGVMLSIDRPDHLPSYKSAGRSITDIEESVLAAIKKKVAKATRYSNDWPLWLAIRYPNHQQVRELSLACVEQCRRFNAGKFERIILFNDPEHVKDASPPSPHYVEIC